MSEATFMDACLVGEATLSDVDDWVDRWHDSDSELSLDDFLGFTPDEGRLWAEKPWTLRYLVNARNSGRDYVEVLRAVENGDFTLAARANSQADATRALRWLEERGRI